ncbi:hypothetical protein BABINDRAFT_159629 [Babjeviella inositovora NRRL Y-12698]|uniref:DNA repair and recombination protein RAD54B n=1 Tax=Babjeviella inositovora NRRL Y-12698 TaxID=984486 RepID=A0A1E3R1B4_9ASCO|nr:uncharacterized protein BABINDRAFT_159629 [Babjeviella inositovora NRRL Y-12698]ODQ83187.1 hypothetical protein BABINDRAFT_159629 [Babjeviella inositovora NRRL Y-12698]
MYKGKVNAPFKPPRMRPALAEGQPDNVAPPPKKTPVTALPVARRTPVTAPLTGKTPAPIQTTPASIKRVQRSPPPEPVSDGSDSKRVYFALWRKPTSKKHKTWDGDAVVIHNLTAGTLVVKGDNGGTYKQLTRSSNTAKFTGEAGVVFSVGGYECEIEHQITDSAELAKFDATLDPIDIKPPKVKVETRVPKSIQVTQFKPVIKAKPKTGARTPLHDPLAPGALVMPLGPDHLTEVIVDPILSQHLREHQREGVRFLYECVMGIREFGGTGALLADEMGLGKTLMTIALVWTLVKQSPLELPTPVARKVLIACPVTLIGNWEREFRKWLGLHRIGVLAIKNSKVPHKDRSDIVSFSKTKVYQVLVMGYEKILTMQEELSKTTFDLIVCDEGHRLKNGANKSLAVLNSLNTERKVVLSGTPIQNDLTEFFQIINFINPGVLGTFAQFQREYIRPIQRGREVNCIEVVREKGEDKAREFIELTNAFTLRRTNSVIANYLPPRTDLLFFCPPTELQVKLFRIMVGSNAYTKALRSAAVQDSLTLINVFRKICSSPSLLTDDKLFSSMMDPDDAADQMLLSKIKTKKTSGKLKTLVHLLFAIQKQSNASEKVVLVSNYTLTLDMLQEILLSINMSYTRLDGSTPPRLRDSIVNSFNRSSVANSFVFLLSAKAGGVGLNLIGASRLILFDNDWNPAVDLQAMARVHRDGQRKPVFIYRLFTTGCLDEKILQRQLMKSNLSDKFLDDKLGATDDLFDMFDLKDLFSLGLETTCGTHDLMECPCEGLGEEIEPEDSEEVKENDEEVKGEKESESNQGFVTALDYQKASQDSSQKKRTIQGALVGYRHIDPVKMGMEIDCRDEATEDFLKGVVVRKEKSPISYMFVKTSAPGLAG